MNAFTPLLFLISFTLISCSSNNDSNLRYSGLTRDLATPQFYSTSANEVKARFKAVVLTNFSSLEDFKEAQQTDRDQADFILGYIQPTLKFLYGPLTNRSLGGEQKGQTIVVEFDNAFLQDSKVAVPYSYEATWLISNEIDANEPLKLPLPYNDEVVYTPNWKLCSDSAPDHQTRDFYWYFWDPERFGCDHVQGIQYQNIDVYFHDFTAQTKLTHPEYSKMIENKLMKMTYAFGYVEDSPNSDPFKSSDPGMMEFQKFIRAVKQIEQNEDVTNFKAIPIKQSKYLRPVRKDHVIGTLFQFERKQIQYEVKVVSSTDIDQMELFAISFAGDKDSFFGWFGHSRVGNGFDAEQFDGLLRRYSDRLSITANYQMIYWAGCNSYSYYTKPFFDFKKNLIQSDVSGTQSLDIISNGLPSYFSLNAANARVVLDALTRPEKKISYQAIIDEIEKQSGRFGIQVLINVLGDEDNH